MSSQTPRHIRWTGDQLELITEEIQGCLGDLGTLYRRAKSLADKLQREVRDEYRNPLPLDLRALFDRELEHHLAAGDPAPGSFTAAMQTDHPRRTLLLEVSELIESIERLRPPAPAADPDDVRLPARVLCRPIAPVGIVRGEVEPEPFHDGGEIAVEYQPLP